MRLTPLLTGLSLCGCLVSTPCEGQYLFLDVNGDGLHTSADVLNPQGTTAVDVWLHTDRNRDGSPASCVTGDGDLTINSYEFILHMVDGTVSWGTPTNHMTAFTVTFGLESTDVDFYMGWGGSDILPAGPYRLATVGVTVLSGSPSLRFQTSTPLSGAYLTSFGSQCDGMDQDNTMKLGREWFDADGTFGAPENRVPVLEQPGDMMVAEGGAADQAISASDPDQDPLTFAKQSGPGFVTVTTTTATTGNLRVLPPFGTVGGQYPVTISASDPYGRSASATLLITVGHVTNHPPRLTQPADMTVVETQVANQFLSAVDPDGDRLTFTKVSGPDLMSIESNSIRLNPPFLTAGSYVGVVRVSDGFGSDQKAFGIVVLPGITLPPIFVTPPTNMFTFAEQSSSQTIAASDYDSLAFLKDFGPDFMSVTTTNPGPLTATGVIHLSPGVEDVGVTSAQVLVTDGEFTVARSFSIEVRPAHVPVIFPMEFPSFVSPGTTHTIQVRAIDPDGDPLSLSQEGLPSYGTLTDAGDGTGTIRVSPPEDTPDGFFIVSVTASDGTFQDTELALLHIEHGPDGGVAGGIGYNFTFAEAAGPYHGVIGAPVSFDATGSFNANRFVWEFGDGATATGRTPQHVYERAGTFRVTLFAVGPARVSRDEATVTISEAYAGRTFAPKGHKTVRLHTGKPSYCFSLEPLDGSYASHQVDPASITLVLPGVGSASSIQGKATLLRDQDENGVLEIDACFSREALRTLFGTRTGTLLVQLEGDVDTGGRFRAPFELVVAPRGALAASLSPLPIRSVSTLRFETTVPGAVRVRVFDVHGRLARTLVDEAHAVPGDHEVVLDGRGGSGLPSGVYWYRVEAEGAAQSGRFVVVR